MNITFRSLFNRLLFLLVLALSSTIIFTACDIYDYDNKEPDWLGSSIYDYLNNDSNYTITVKLIKDLQYDEVLKLTGSKTLFVTSDSAYNEFFKQNVWNVRRYEDLTLAQKKILLFYPMVNNSYTMDVFSNFNSNGNLYEGTAMRRHTALNVIDSVPFVKGENLPASKYWNAFRNKGLWLISDLPVSSSNNNNLIPMVFFTNDFLRKFSLTSEDFATLTGGLTRKPEDVHLFNTRLIKKDIVCKNGYINVLDRVLIPPMNMAQYITSNPSTKIFAKLLDRFSAPYINEAATLLYRQIHTGFNDTLYSKVYFSSIGGYTKFPQAGKPSGADITNLLPYNPGWNSLNTGAIQSDMGAMFVPSDEAMNNYFNSGVGEILRSRYKTWDSVPDNIILRFIKRHMRTSVVESVPSKFSKMVDAENNSLPVQRGHIVDSYTGVNGQVYVTNEVYPPIDYISVYSPVLLSENTQIMNWAINISETSVDGTLFEFYRLYLNSPVSTYSLFVPTDEFFSNYLDPIAWGQNVKAALKFWYDKSIPKPTVKATVYKIDPVTGTYNPATDSVDVITNAAFLKNRLWNILDSHIVVGNVETGKQYYITKANDIIRVKGTGNSMIVEGGGDVNNGTKCHVLKNFVQQNGNTYFIDKPIRTALSSVYKKLSETPEFKAFFDLLNGVPDTCIQQIFTQQGVDYRVKFFNAYRYTVYVPTNEKIQAAIADKKIKAWEEIYAIKDKMQQYYEIQKMIRFLKYHFQDEAVFTNSVVNDRYQSATIKTDNVVTHFGTARNKYYKIGVLGDGNTLTLTADTPKDKSLVTAKVIKSNGLYDILAKDYIFAKLPTLYKNIDGSGAAAGTAFNTSLITTSASAVIHQIDNILLFE